MKVKVLVVDDEDLARARICRLLEQSPLRLHFEIREARNGLEALTICSEWPPDILFLDMEMPEMSGTDVLHHLKHDEALVIFQTAHEHYALRAFEHAAVDFLLKPYTPERFAEALGRTMDRLTDRTKLRAVTTTLAETKQYLRTFVVRVGERNRIINEDDVLSFTSEDHVTMICTSSLSYAYVHSLSYLEQHLDPQRFLRIHKSRIIRTDALASYTSSRPVMAIMKNGERFRVSREREKDLRDFFAGAKGP